MDIRSLEHPTLKVPYENLNKRFRSSQKTIEREVSHVNSAVADVERAFKESVDGSVGDFPALLATLHDRLQAFEAKTREAVTSEVAAALNCRQRIDHLRVGCCGGGGGSSGGGGTVALNVWKKTRLDRMLVEHFLRSGFYNSAIRLAQAADIVDLTNIGLFLVAKEVEESLSRKDTAKCLAWCHDNKSKMRKLKSNLEFNIRMEEFVELVKEGRKVDAVRHARRHLSQADADQFPQVQRGMALLAFPRDTIVQPYRDLLNEDRWQRLVEQFRAENYRLFQLSSQSVFSVALQAGLSCLKTQKCTSKRSSSSSSAGGDRVVGNDRNSECPVCQDLLSDLATNLPYAHCSQSRLICYISGKPLNEHNHPMMLPNGYVYGEHALTKMAAENDAQIVCPRTKEIYAFSDAEKIYVM